MVGVRNIAQTLRCTGVPLFYSCVGVLDKFIEDAHGAMHRRPLDVFRPACRGWHNKLVCFSAGMSVCVCACRRFHEFWKALVEPLSSGFQMLAPTDNRETQNLRRATEQHVKIRFLFFKKQVC